MRNVLAILKKDLNEIFSSVSMTFLVVMPVCLSFVFALIMGSDSLYNIGVCAPVNSQALQFISKEAKDLELAAYDSVEALVAAIEQRKVQAGLVIPDEVSGEAQIELLVEDGQKGTSAMLEPFLTKILCEFRGISYPGLIKTIYITSKSQGGLRGTSMWILLGILAIGLTLISGYFAEEREKKTMAALIVMPVSRRDLAAGRIATAVATCLLMGLGTIFVNNIGVQDYLTFTAVIVLGAVVYGSIGLILGGLARSQTAATTTGTLLLLFFLIVPLLADSKYIMPLAVASPSLYIYRGIDASLGLQAGWPGSVLAVIILAGFALVTWLAALLLMGSERINEINGI